MRVAQVELVDFDINKNHSISIESHIDGKIKIYVDDKEMISTVVSVRYRGEYAGIYSSGIGEGKIIKLQYRYL